MPVVIGKHLQNQQSKHLRLGDQDCCKGLKRNINLIHLDYIYLSPIILNQTQTLNPKNHRG